MEGKGCQLAELDPLFQAIPLIAGGGPESPMRCIFRKSLIQQSLSRLEILPQKLFSTMAEPPVLTTSSYGYSKSLGAIEMEAGVERLQAAVKTEGFGILTEIDVKAVLKTKIDADVPPYRIFGACNPMLAHKGMAAEPLLGLLLPCNVVLMEESDGTISVSVVSRTFAAQTYSSQIKPGEMMKCVDNPALNEVIEAADEKLQRILEAM